MLLYCLTWSPLAPPKVRYDEPKYTYYSAVCTISVVPSNHEPHSCSCYQNTPLNSISCDIGLQVSYIVWKPWKPHQKTLCGNLKTTCNNTLVETFLSLTIHQMVESTCTFWETLKPRPKQKPKWFRQQPYIHSIDINFVMTIEDTKVSLIAIHILVGNTENQPEDWSTTSYQHFKLDSILE